MSILETAPHLDAVVQRIGRRVAELRTARGLTLEELAAAVGFTKGYLSKIENGKQAPPIATLIKLAQGLGTDISDLLEGESVGNAADEICIVRSWQQESVTRGDGSEFDYVYFALAQKMRQKHMEPFVMTFNERADRAMAAHDGEEFLFVLTGEIEWEMEIEGKRKAWVLSRGDSCYFNSRFPHRGRSLKGESSALLMIYKAEA